MHLPQCWDVKQLISMFPEYKYTVNCCAVTTYRLFKPYAYSSTVINSYACKNMWFTIKRDLSNSLVTEYIYLFLSIHIQKEILRSFGKIPGLTVMRKMWLPLYHKVKSTLSSPPFNNNPLFCG